MQIVPTKVRRHTRSALPLAATLLGAASVTACNAIPKVEVHPDGASTSESGGSVTLAIKLAARPVGPIEVFAVSADPAEASVSAAVRFDQRDYGVSQAIRVTGVDDSADDGDVAYDVLVYARSLRDPRAQPELVAALRLVNRDDEVPRFEALGDLPGGGTASFAADVSADGAVVVGYSGGPDGDEAVRFSAGLLEGLGGLQSRATRISPDGTLVGGTVADTHYDGGRAAVLWRGEGSYERLPGPLYSPGGMVLFWVVDVGAVLDDGRVFGACVQGGAYGEPLACSWSGPEQVDTFGPGLFYAADAVHAAGARNSAHHAPFGSQPMFDAGSLGYPAAGCGPTTGCLGAARDFALGGAVIVGTSTVPPPSATPTTSPVLHDVAFVYTPDEGPAALADLAGGEDASGAYAVSADGRVVGGFGTDERGRVATLWRDRTPRALEDLVLEAGGELPEGFTLEEVRALSADARVIVGNGHHDDGTPDGFRIALPSAP